MQQTSRIRGPKDLARILKERRKELGLTQDDLASLHDLSRYAVINAEAAKTDPKLSTINTLLEGVGLTLVAVPTQFADRVQLPHVSPDTEDGTMGEDLEFDPSWIDE